jgi:hypothetical protein
MGYHSLVPNFKELKKKDKWKGCSFDIYIMKQLEDMPNNFLLHLGCKSKLKKWEVQKGKIIIFI